MFHRRHRHARTGRKGARIRQAGNNGTPGGKADALAHEFQAPGNFQGTGNAPAIAISSSGGRGGNGSNASDGTTEQNGGNGMAGGDGGIVQVQVDPGVAAAAQGQLPTVEITSTGATGGGGSLSGSEGTNGSSGPGGNGGQVTVTSNGSISASGSGAALAVGSLGGTGGAGGDYKLPYNKDGVDGGNGGPGGTVIVTVGGAATSVGNSVFVQSAGGNGGTGGRPDTASFPIGAQGGTGGDGAAGGTVAVTIARGGALATSGQESPGVWAQSLGGGGGAGGQGGGDANGGNAGSGAAGGAVTITNNGSIATTGADAPGLLGQSLGGVGANGGRGGGWGTSGGYGGTGGSGVGVTILGSGGTIRTGGGNGGNSNGWLSIGGDAGSAANGGNVTVNISNQIATAGERSAGILAQSIGGGGGNGGNASGNGLGLNIIIGGTAGGGGTSGQVLATSGGAIATSGLHASGLVLQSIGGGGGNGGAAYSKTLSGAAGASVSVGGSGGAGGAGGIVGQVADPNGFGTLPTNSGRIITAGANAFGILGQSIGGGGGGIVKTLSTDAADNNGGGATAKGGDYGLNLTFGGAAGTSGNANAVTVNSGGSIATSGSNAYGILAQSIGGGGGLVLGGKPNGSNFFGSGRASGSGSTVQVTVDGSIATTGQGAVGILAQSIGGGGGLAGDIGQTSQRAGFTPSPNRSGDGGPVTIGIGQNGTVTTNALNTPVILAQSIGGGGGRVTNNSGAFSGTAGGAGTGGAVTISVAGQVSALGAASPGIYAESVGAGAAPAGSVVKVTVAQGGLVSGGKDFNAGDGYGAGIYVVSGGQGASNPNTITNNGTITSVNGSSGTAIYSTGGYTTVVNNGGGTITGAVNLLNGGGGGTVVNNPGGTLQPGGAVNLGAAGRLVNSGLIMLGSPGQAGGTTVTGDFEQTATGVLRVNLQAGANTAGNLQVNGAARLAGSVDVVVSDPANLKPGVKQANILTATGGVTTAGARLAIASTPIVQYSLAARDANNVDLSYAVDYGAAQALRTQGLASSNRGEVGRVLNAVLAGDPGGLAPLVGRLAALPTAPAVAATLDALSGEAAADVQQTVFAAQQAYTNTVLRHAVGEERGNGPSAPYATASLSPVAGPSVNDRGMRVWVGGFGANDVLNGTDGQGSLHTQVAGAVMGLDKWFGNNRMAGVSVGGGTSDFSVADRASLGHTTSVNLGFHGLARFGQAYVSGVVAYGNFATDLKRNGLGGATGLAAAGRGSVASNVLGGRVEAGWSQPLGGSGLVATPFAALGVDQQWQGAFSETVIAAPGGSGLGLRFHGTDRASVPLTLGTRLGSTFQLGGATCSASRPRSAGSTSSTRSGRSRPHSKRPRTCRFGCSA